MRAINAQPMDYTHLRPFARLGLCTDVITQKGSTSIVAVTEKRR